MNTSLIKHATVNELVAAFEDACETVRGAFAAIRAGQATLDRAFLESSRYSSTVRIDASRNGWEGHDWDAERAIERMTRAAWSHIVDRLELRRAMSIERYKKMLVDFEKGAEVIPITRENVFAFAEGHLRALPDMHAEAVREVFNWLRPRLDTRSDGYKRNDRFVVAPKIIIVYMVERRCLAAGLRIRYDRQQELIALENVFTMLDGKGQIAKSHYSALQSAFDDKANTSGGAETPYFKVRGYKNGNLHLEFKRRDLLKKFNAIAGGANLHVHNPDEHEGERAIVHQQGAQP